MKGQQNGGLGPLGASTPAIVVRGYSCTHAQHFAVCKAFTCCGPSQLLFTERGPEAQSGKGTCPRLHSP